MKDKQRRNKMENRIANTILNQMGGSKIQAMIGMKDLAADECPKIKSVSNIYADQLNKTFENFTGLTTSL